MKEWLKARDSEDVKNFYDKKYIDAGPDAFRWNDWLFFFETVNLFFNDLEPTHSILDCGAGSGHFLDYVVKRDPFRHPYLCAIELSPEACRIFRGRLKGRAYLVEGDYHEESFDKNTFDIVTCWGTIEHSFSLELAFSRLIDYAKPGGLIMITIPIETENCLDGILAEKNDMNNERFATAEEWIALFSQWLRPFHTFRIGDDLLMVFRKWVDA